MSINDTTAKAYHGFSEKDWIPSADEWLSHLRAYGHGIGPTGHMSLYESMDHIYLSLYIVYITHDAVAF